MWLPKWRRNWKRSHTLPLLWRNAERKNKKVAKRKGPMRATLAGECQDENHCATEAALINCNLCTYSTKKVPQFSINDVISTFCTHSPNKTDFWKTFAVNCVISTSVHIQQQSSTVCTSSLSTMPPQPFVHIQLTKLTFAKGLQSIMSSQLLYTLNNRPSRVYNFALHDVISTSVDIQLTDLRRFTKVCYERCRLNFCTHSTTGLRQFAKFAIHDVISTS